MNVINAAEVYVEYFRKFWDLATPARKEFAGTNHPTGWAASFESLLAFKTEVKRRHSNPLNTPLILDAGAGASSAVLRLWFNHVVTCDSDETYMMEVKQTCEKLAEMFECPKLATGDWHHGFYPASVDSTFYDYDNYDRRIQFMPTVMENTGSIIYIDDVDHRDRCMSVRGSAYWEARMKGWRLEDRPDLLDEHGRWGIMATRL